jgi:GDP-L-fucose synthase
MFFRDAKVLITGAAGLIGSKLLEELHRQGAQVRAAFHHKRPPLLDGVEYCEGTDLTNRHTCDELVKDQQYVFLCAASTSGAAAIVATPLVHVTPNIIMNAQMLEAAYLAGVQKVMYTSSTTGYPVTGKPYREEDMFTGDPYEKYFPAGWMKRYTEMLCRMYAENLSPRMAAIVVRPTTVYGPRDKFDPGRSHVLPALIRKVIERQDPIEIWGTGDDIRDFIYIDDLVEGMLIAMEKIDRYDPINLGLGQSYSVKDLLQTVLKADGYQDARIVFDPSKPSTVPKQVVDCSKAERLLGFKAKVGIEEGVCRTIAWYRRECEEASSSALSGQKSKH